MILNRSIPRSRKKILILGRTVLTSVKTLAIMTNVEGTNKTQAGAETMTITIFTMHEEAGRLLAFVDSRTAAGTLVASELFNTVAEAEAYAMSIGGGR